MTSTSRSLFRQPQKLIKDRESLVMFGRTKAKDDIIHFLKATKRTCFPLEVVTFSIERHSGSKDQWGLSRERFHKNFHEISMQYRKLYQRRGLLRPIDPIWEQRVSLVAPKSREVGTRCFGAFMHFWITVSLSLLGLFDELLSPELSVSLTLSYSLNILHCHYSLRQ